MSEFAHGQHALRKTTILTIQELSGTSHEPHNARSSLSVPQAQHKIVWL